MWIRARDEEMPRAGAALRQIARRSDHLIVESNRIVEFLAPDLYILVLDFRISDFKDSARSLYPRADGYVLSHPSERPSGWPQSITAALRRKPCFGIDPPDYLPAGLLEDLSWRQKPLELLAQRATAAQPDTRR